MYVCMYVSMYEYVCVCVCVRVCVWAVNQLVYSRPTLLTAVWGLRYDGHCRNIMAVPSV